MGEAIKLSRGYTDELASVLKILADGKYLHLLNTGDPATKITEGVVYMNYGTLEELNNQTEQDVKNYNLTCKTVSPYPCFSVKLAPQSIANEIARRNGAGVEAPSIFLNNLCINDACIIVFDNPGLKRSGYYRIVDEICKDLGLKSREEFYFLSFVKFCLVVEIYRMSTNGERIPLLVASSYTKTYIFESKAESKRELAKVIYCGDVWHSQLFYDGRVITASEKSREHAHLSLSLFILFIFSG